MKNLYGIYYCNNWSWIGPYRPDRYLFRSKKVAQEAANRLRPELKKFVEVRKCRIEEAR